MHNSKTDTRRRGWFAPVLAGAILIVSAGLIGCQGNDTSGSTVGASSTGKIATVELPSLNALDDALNLTDAQSGQMATALNTWSRTIDERKAARADKSGPQGFLRNAGSPPAMTFLADASDFLDNGQMVKLAGILKERQTTMRDQMRTQFRDHKGNRDGAPRFEGARAHFDQMAKDLNLTEEQQAALTKLRESMREKMQGTRGQREKSGDQRFRGAGQGTNFRDRMRTELESILTPDQLQRLDAIHEERSSQRKEVATEHATERLSDRVDFLTRVLKLDDSQKASLETTLRDAQTAHQQMRNSRTDHADWQAIRAQAEKIRTETESSITALLTADQKELYASLTDLLPMGPRGPHPPR